VPVPQREITTLLVTGDRDEEAGSRRKESGNRENDC